MIAFIVSKAPACLHLEVTSASFQASGHAGNWLRLNAYPLPARFLNLSTNLEMSRPTVGPRLFLPFHFDLANSFLPL